MPDFYGSAGADTMHGTDKGEHFKPLGGDDLVYGGGGDDVVFGSGGSDTELGGDGNDVLYATSTFQSEGGGLDSLNGGHGDDRLSGGQNDTLIGGSGDDYVSGGGQGAILEGGSGRDGVSLHLASGYSGDLSELFAQRDTAVTLDGTTFSGFEYGTVSLGKGDNVVTLDPHLKGWGLSGGSGNDQLTGNGHADSLSGYAGDDTISGLGGADQVNAWYLQEVTDRDLILGGAGDDTVTSGHGSATIEGGTGDDVLTTLQGSAVLKGGAGRDDLVGGLSNDLLVGGGGLDSLHGGKGADTLEGGAGQDHYFFFRLSDSAADAPDLIRDKDFGVVDVSKIDADASTSAQEHFTLVDQFTGHAGELTIAYSVADHLTHVEGDVDGDGQADLVILAQGRHVDPGDYLL